MLEPETQREQSNAEARCHICDKPVSELEPFGGPGDPLVGDFTGEKLLKTYREEYPRHYGTSWECRDCILNDDGLWEIAEQKRLGRTLTYYERRLFRYKFLLDMWERGPNCRNLSETEKDELWYQLHHWQPSDWQSKSLTHTDGSVVVTLTAEELRQVRDEADKMQPYGRK